MDVYKKRKVDEKNRKKVKNNRRKSGMEKKTGEEEKKVEGNEDIRIGGVIDKRDIKYRQSRRCMNKEEGYEDVKRKDVVDHKDIGKKGDDKKEKTWKKSTNSTNES